MPDLTETLRLALDRREYPRVPVSISGQITISSERAPRGALVTNLSAGGAGLRYADVPPRAGLTGVLAVEGFGSFEGITTRDGGAVCGLRFLGGEAERRHLLECLSVFVRSGLTAVDSLRKNECWHPQSTLSLTRQSGAQHRCEVRDISLHGIALSTNVIIPKGEHVPVEKMFGRVVQGLSGEVTVQFLRYLNEQTAARL
jgi:PilZ domain